MMTFYDLKHSLMCKNLVGAIKKQDDLYPLMDLLSETLAALQKRAVDGYEILKLAGYHEHATVMSEDYKMLTRMIESDIMAIGYYLHKRGILRPRD